MLGLFGGSEGESTADSSGMVSRNAEQDETTVDGGLQCEGNDAEMWWKTVVNIAEFPRSILASGATFGATFASSEG